MPHNLMRFKFNLNYQKMNQEKLTLEPASAENITILSREQLKKVVGGDASVDFTDPTKPQLGGSVGALTPPTPYHDEKMVKALDGNPTL